ncbi:MAG: hypothetical protein ACT6FF_07175 [Methanosarcinaceae archaeon]
MFASGEGDCKGGGEEGEGGDGVGGFIEVLGCGVTCCFVSVNIAALRAYMRAVINPQKHTVRRPHPFNARTRAGLHYCLRVARGDGKGGGEEGESGNGMGGFIEASGCGVSCCAVPSDIAPLRAYMRAIINL